MLSTAIDLAQFNTLPSVAISTGILFKTESKSIIFKKMMKMSWFQCAIF
jgi:hypothetical protein